jgi:hypothetical protein
MRGGCDVPSTELEISVKLQLTLVADLVKVRTEAEHS